MTEDVRTLQKSNERRLALLAQRGVAIGGMDIGYIRAMLETLLGDRLEEAEMLHEARVAEALDRAEAETNRAILTAGLNGR